MRAGLPPSDIVFTGVGKIARRDRPGGAARTEGHQRRVGGRAGAHRSCGAGARRPRARGAARESRHRLGHASAYFDRPSRQQVRRAARTGAGDLSQDGEQPGLQPVGHPRPPGLADRDARSAAEGGVDGGEAGAELRDVGLPLDYIDLGGGLGISYDGSRVPDGSALCGGGAAARATVRARRSCWSPAASRGRPARSSRASSTSRTAPGGRHFAVLDASMTELIRPALYGAFHRIEAVTPREGRELFVRCRGPGLREQRRVWQRSAVPAAGRRRSAGHSRRWRVWLRDGIDLQPPTAGGRGADRRGTGTADPPPPDLREMLALEL